MSSLDEYILNEAGAPFRDPVAGEVGYIDPVTMRAFAQSIQDAVNQVAEWASLSRFNYSYSSSVNLPPQTGQIRTDALPSLAKKAWVSKQTGDGEDTGSFLGKYKTGARIRLTDKNESVKFALYSITSDPIDNVNYWEFPVNVIDAGQEVTAQACYLIFAL